MHESNTIYKQKQSKTNILMDVDVRGQQRRKRRYELWTHILVRSNDLMLDVLMGLFLAGMPLLASKSDVLSSVWTHSDGQC